MSIISSKSVRSKQGFTPYHSESDFNEKELSLFSRLNLNERVQLERPLAHEISFDKSDLFSVGSKKRKLSEELIKSSKIGNKTFLNRSLIGKSSLNDELLIGLQSDYSQDNNLKKDHSENSCPIILNNEHSDIFQYEPVEQRPRFTKTKNLLRNISSYMHKFILYNKRGQLWVRQYFKKKMIKIMRKSSTSKSLSNDKSQDIRIQEQQNEQLQRRGNEQKSNVKGISLEKQSKIIQQKQQQQESYSNFQLKINDEVKQFCSWLSQLSLGNFSDYEKIWTTPHKYRALYRVICYKYYRNDAFCDILRSRLTTKEISVKYLVQFIEGILQPNHFYRFR